MRAVFFLVDLDEPRPVQLIERNEGEKSAEWGHEYEEIRECKHKYTSWMDCYFEFFFIF